MALNNHKLVVTLSEKYVNEETRKKLETYFSLRRKSGGGDCVVTFRNDHSFRVHFKQEVDRDRVFHQGKHEVNLEAGRLVQLVVTKEEKLVETVSKPDICKEKSRIPSSEPESETHTEPKATSAERRIVITHTAEVDEEYLSMYFENLLGNEITIFSLSKNKNMCWCEKDEDVEKILRMQYHSVADETVEVSLWDDAEHELDAHRIRIQGFGDDTNLNLIQMYIENRADVPNENFTIEYLHETDAAVVTFREPIDWMMLQKNSRNKPLEGNAILVTPLPVTRTVCVEGLTKDIPSSLLKLYFENKKYGGEIKEISMDERSNSAYILFETASAAHQVFRRKHTLKGVVLKVYRYYEDMQCVLHDNLPHDLKVPEPLQLPIDPDVLQFINNKSNLVIAFQESFKSIHASVDLKSSSHSVLVIPNFKIRSPHMLKHAQHWKTANEDILKEVTDKIIKKDITVSDRDVWNRILFDTEKISQDKCKVKYDGFSQELTLIGMVDDVKSVKQKLELIISCAEDAVSLERNRITKEHSLGNAIMFDLFQRMDAEKDINKRFPNVSCEFDTKKHSLFLTGMKDDHDNLRMFVDAKIQSLEVKNFNASDGLVRFLSIPEQQSTINADIGAQGLISKFDIFDGKIRITSMNTQMKEAEKFLQENVKEFRSTVKNEAKASTKTKEWDDFFESLQYNYSVHERFCLFEQEKDSNGYSISLNIVGFTSAVKSVEKDLELFYNKNSFLTKIVKPKSLECFEYLTDVKRITEDPFFRQRQVEVDTNNKHFILMGHPDDVDEMDDFLAKQNVLSQDFRVNKPGASKISSKRFDNLKDLCKKENCLLKMKSSNLSSLPPASLITTPTTNDVSSIKLNSGLQISLDLKNLQDMQTNVIVSTVSTNLDLSKGVLSQAIFNKAGPALQTQLHQASGASTTKKRVIDTSALGSNLDCEEVYFTFLPNWKKESPEATETLCKVVRTCLELAEKAGHKSIAFPALGTGNLGYPVHLSATFMLREVLRFNNEQLPVSLKDVHFVLFPKNQQVFKAFQDVIRDFNTKSATGTTHIDGKISIRNMKISIGVGDITSSGHCAVVNSTNNSLDDQKGVSGAILSAAGNSVQQELQNFGKQNDGAVVVTGPGAMNCKQIIHVVETKDMNTLKLATIKVLENCSSRCLPSVSFPALLTGNATLTSKDVAKTMYEAFDSFIRSNQQSIVRQIQIILFQPEMYLDYCKVFSECSSSKVLPSPLTNVATTKQMKVEIICGDITKETTDAIVNSTNSALNLNTGVSKAVLDAGGKSVVDECNAKGQQPDDGVVVTGAGNLSCKHIIHAVGQTHPAKITSCILTVLQESEKLNLSSLSLPAFGTGAGSLSAAAVADAMVKAIEQHTARSLIHIRIVVFQSKMVPDFQAALQKGNQNIVSGKNQITASMLNNMQVKIISGDITKETTDAITNSTNSTLNLNSGVSKAILEAAGKSVVDECKAKGQQPADGVVVTGAGNLSCKHIIHTVGQTHPAKITSCVLAVLQESENLKLSSLSLPAFGTGVGKLSAAAVADAMMDAIKQHTPHSLLQIRIVVFQPNLVSDFQTALTNQITAVQQPVTASPQATNASPAQGPSRSPPSFQIFSQSKKDIENAITSLQAFFDDEICSDTVPLEHKLQQAQVDQLRAIEASDEMRITIRASNVIFEGTKVDVQSAKLKLYKLFKVIAENEKNKVPETWTDMKGSTYMKVPLSETSQEYIDVKNNFMKSAQAAFKVLKIERIQNTKLWEGYLLREKNVEKSTKPSVRTLFHGTTVDVCDQIFNHGFDRNYSGKNATAFGKGTYFAVNSSYSANKTYSPLDSKGQQHIIQARVATGDFHIGNQSMVAPPPKHGQSDLYDSLVDNVTNPTIFVIFRDDQAYPEYVISFSL